MELNQEEEKGDLGISNLSVEELLKLTQNYMEALKITEAQQVLEHAIAKYPDNVGIIDSLSELLFSLGDVDRAIKVK